MWQQRELVTEIESDLRDNEDWSMKWLANFNAGKTQFVSFDWSNSTDAIDGNMDGPVLL